MKSRISRHARSIWLAVILLTLAGLVAAVRLPVALFPQIDYPRVSVAIDAGDRDAAQMAAEITRPAEIALRAIPGVTQIRSTTSRGSAEIALSFSWGDDIVAGSQATQSAMATLLPDLPPGVRFEVRRSDPSLFPAIGVSLTSQSLDAAALKQIAERKIRPALLGVTGVAGVDVLGGAAREVAVTVDPARLQGLGLSLTDVVNALGKSNAVSGAGRIEDRHRLYLVLVDSRAASVEDIRRIPIKSSAATGSVVLLGQVAVVGPSLAPNFTRVNSNGRTAVLINVRQAQNGNTVAIVKAVQARLREIGVPPTVALSTYYDQSELVTGAAAAVRDAILIGALLAGAVLYLFLRSPRLMLITGLTLPAVLAGACLIIYALGLTFNMMTLGGMAAAVGLVIDDAVVMLEHMMRRMQEGEAGDPPTLLAAAAEMGQPLLGSTAATIIVFLPLAFISGVTGGFFKALAITMVSALGISLLYARLVIPLIAANWLRPADAQAADRAGAALQAIDRRYHKVSSRAWSRPALFAGSLAVLLLLCGSFAWTRVPSGFMPYMDEGGFVLDYKAQPGAALTDTDRLLRQVERIIISTPEVASYSRRTGIQLGGGLTEADEGDYFIRLKNGSRRSIDAVMTEIRQRIANEVPGLEIELIQLMGDLIGDLTAVPQPIEVKLFGDDPGLLKKAAASVAGAVEKVPGVVEVVNGLRVAGDSVAIRVDRAAAAQQGLDGDMIAAQLGALTAGTPATQLRVGEQLIAVRVTAPGDLRSRVADVSNLPLTAPDGHSVRVGQIAEVSILAGQTQIRRENLAPFVAVTGRLEGRDLGSAMRDVQTAVRNLKLPGAVRVEFGGLYSQQKQSFTDLTMVFVAALLLSVLLLTFLFERLTWTVSAISTVLLAAASVLIGLWITRIELNISALMGLTMVAGMVTELVIFYLAELDSRAPVTLAALREAGAKRLRPILMSALIAILTLAPLALGLSRGAGLQQPLATAIIFGLSAGVPLVLIFLPAMLLATSRRPHSFERQPPGDDVLPS